MHRMRSLVYYYYYYWPLDFRRFTLTSPPHPGILWSSLPLHSVGTHLWRTWQIGRQYPPSRTKYRGLGLLWWLGRLHCLYFNYVQWIPTSKAIPLRHHSKPVRKKFYWIDRSFVAIITFLTTIRTLHITITIPSCRDQLKQLLALKCCPPNHLQKTVASEQTLWWG